MYITSESADCHDIANRLVTPNCNWFEYDRINCDAIACSWIDFDPIVCDRIDCNRKGCVRSDCNWIEHDWTDRNRSVFDPNDCDRVSDVTARDWTGRTGRTGRTARHDRDKLDRLSQSSLLHLKHAHASATAVRARVVPTAAAALHMSSSQKHMWPVPVLSIMQTWSTMNRLIWSWEVHVRRTTSYAGTGRNGELGLCLCK